MRRVFFENDPELLTAWVLADVKNKVKAEYFGPPALAEKGKEMLVLLEAFSYACEPNEVLAA